MLVTKSASRRKTAIILTCLLGLIITYLVLNSQTQRTSPTQTAADNVLSLTLDCSEIKAGAVGTLTDGLLARCGDDAPLPTASIAKIITALVTLNSVEVGEVDEISYELDLTDISFAGKASDEGGSSVPVLVGEELTLRQMLAGMIVASSNNLADSIVYHHFGSFNNYKKAAMEYLRARGLKETVIGADASGLDAGTKSTARDLFELGRLALENEVVRELVARQSEDLLYTMEDVQTTNHSLARGYSGIKTGYTGEAGYCLLFSKEVEGKTVIGVVLGAGSDQARQDKADEFIKVLVGEGKSLPVAQPPNPARN